ncbi:MAG: hypothetical protein ACREHE_08535 [Rhizomicrobium sp.]
MTFKLAAAAAALVLVSGAASAQGSFSLTQFFSTSNLQPLAGTPTVLNLAAQMDHRTLQQDVNNFDDFMLINGTGKKRVFFNRHLMNQGTMVLGSWIGVAQFDNHTITADLEDGWKAVKAKYSLGSVAHVIVYKTLNTNELVYDYASPIGSSEMNCQEYLYTPSTKGFQLGMKTGCWIGLSTTYSRRTSAGSGTRAQ